MKLHVFLLGWSISIAGTVLLLFVLYLVRHVTVEGFTVERGGADRDGTALKLGCPNFALKNVSLRSET